jgi:diguanylate cyclase (GGDEF)-like protein/PAS domain S-box-containing protein
MIERKPVIRVLLVEDDAVDRLACRRALAQHPDYEFVVVEAETGRQGIQLVLDRHPDLILLDFHLPDLDGLEFLAELAREDGEHPAPVLMLTGADNVGVAVEAMKRGARDYLVKDTGRQYLQLLPAVIERVLRQQQAVSEKARAEAHLRAAEAKFRTLVEQIPAIAYIAALDVPGNLLYISPQVRRLGFSPEEWLADPEGLLKQVHPDDRAQVTAAYAGSFESGEPLRCEYRVFTREGEMLWLLDEARVVRDALGEPLFLQGTLVDITQDRRVQEELEYHRRRLEDLVAQRTAQLDKRSALLEEANANLARELDERRQAEQALRASEERFRLLLGSVGEGIYGLDTDGRCTFVNDAALAMLGYAREELYGQPTHPLIHHSRADGTPYGEAECPIYDSFRIGAVVHAGIETLWRKDGSAFTAEYSAAPLREAGRIIGAVLVFRDVTESHAFAQRLAYQATHDALTGLINRGEFEHRLERVLGGQHVEGSEHALCYLDLDQFKVVNDSCGHAAGDELLRQLSARLQSHMRARDTLARMGGDEFGILLEHCPPDQALRIATEMRDTVHEFRFTWQGRSFSLGASIGVVPLTAATESTAAALSAADAACYLAKEQGRNRVHLYHPEDADLIEHRSQMRWVSRLTQALDEGRFRLYYQPILPLTGGQRERPHYEILLRLLDEDGRLVEPMAFVPAAERYNLMPAIDRWVLRTVIAGATAHCAAPAAERPIFAVNLSGRSLGDERLPDYVREQLTHHHVPGDMLCLEITETAAIANLNQASRQIAELKRLGCLVALDDFGSGMSSFSYLKTLPVDFLKIDGGFIRTLADDQVNRAMTEAINRVAHVMTIQTIAESAESDSVVAILRELGVDHAQGYALARPRPIEDLAGDTGTAGRPVSGLPRAG